MNPEINRKVFYEVGMQELLQGRPANGRLGPGGSPGPPPTWGGIAPNRGGETLRLEQVGSGAPGELPEVGAGPRSGSRGKPRAGWGETPGGQADSVGPGRAGNSNSDPERRRGEPPTPTFTPPLTHLRTARTSSTRDSPLARYLSWGHPPTWPLYFRATTLRPELRGGTEWIQGADGGGRTSGLPCLGLSRGGARSHVGPRPLAGPRPTVLSPASVRDVT